jgi:cation transport protein ChaC
MANETWLFGYGSIMWKTGFNFETSELCHAKGWARRFWQGSADHRGTAEFPGRVVTLIESASEHCWGTAYRLPPCEASNILARLDYREKGGYDRTKLSLTLSNGSTIEGITYIAHTHTTLTTLASHRSRISRGRSTYQPDPAAVTKRIYLSFTGR